jgi:hypothetical protein
MPTRLVGLLRRRWAEALSLYVIAILFCVRVGTHGIPWKAFEDVGWAAAVLVAVGFREPRRLLRGSRDWAVFLGLVVLYGIGMDRADDVNGAVHYSAARIDEAMFGASPVTWLQDRLWDGSPNLLDYASFFVYMSHFWAVIVVATIMWRRSMFWEFARPWCLLTAAGALTYLAYPAAPPWYAGHVGEMAHVDRLTTIISYQLAGVRPGGNWDGIADGGFIGNPFGAVPSLHFAYPVLIAAVFWSHRRLRPLLVTYPLAMGFALVYLGEHFVFDLIVGGAYAGAAVLLERAIRRGLVSAGSAATAGRPVPGDHSHVPGSAHDGLAPPKGAAAGAVLRQPSG